MADTTTDPSILQVYDYVDRGIPIGRPAEVNLRNNHAQYIFTWYARSIINKTLPRPCPPRLRPSPDSLLTEAGTVSL